MGADRGQLERLATHPVAPDVIGLNYYATSDRFLDDRLERYPSSLRGGNGHQQYVDVDAVRVDGVGLRGHAAVLTEAWERYRRPVAITEAHLGCTREEQMRWLIEAWCGAQQAAAQGVDVRGVAAWALLGSWDWDTLLTRPEMKHYEPGAFDIRGGRPQPTAVARVICDLAAGRQPAHPVLDTPGWWRRARSAHLTSAHPLLVTGANGTLGRAFLHGCESRGLPCVGLSRRDMPIHNPEAVRAAVSRWQPWAIVNAAGYVRVDDAEHESTACRLANAVGPAILATVCRRAGIPLVTFSSDLVFDGISQRPYIESDPVGPLNIYGRTKAEAERRVLALYPEALVIRSSAFFGPWDRANFLTRVLEALKSGGSFRAEADAIVSPTYVPDLVERSLDLLIDGAAGLWHVANTGAVSWLTFARMAAAAAGLSSDGIRECQAVDLQRPAARPFFSVLGTERGSSLPPLEDSLLRFVRDRTVIDTAA
jgi:dTDP-4-dehydrorhamnose reductase